MTSRCEWSSCQVHRRCDGGGGAPAGRCLLGFGNGSRRGVVWGVSKWSGGGVSGWFGKYVGGWSGCFGLTSFGGGGSGGVGGTRPSVINGGRIFGCGGRGCAVFGFSKGRRVLQCRGGGGSYFGGGGICMDARFGDGGRVAGGLDFGGVLGGVVGKLSKSDWMVGAGSPGAGMSFQSGMSMASIEMVRGSSLNGIRCSSGTSS